VLGPSTNAEKLHLGNIEYFKTVKILAFLCVNCFKMQYSSKISWDGGGGMPPDPQLPHTKHTSA